MIKFKVNISKAMDSINRLFDDIDMLIMKADEDLKEQLDAEGYVATEEAVNMVNELEDEWTQAYNDQCDDLLEQLQSSLEVDDFIEKKWPKLKNETDLRDAIYEIFHNRFLSMLEGCVLGFLAGDDPDLLTDGMEILSKPAKDFVEGWSGQLADLMHLSTNEQIESILINGQKEHLSVMQVAQNISDSGIRNPGYKARRAAMTEMLRAESYGQLEAMKQNPAVAEKEWVHTGMHKNKPRPNHVAISGQRKPVDEPFDLTGADGGSYQPMCPRDTNLPAGESINCHCLMKSIRDPNWKNLSVEERRALREQYMQELEMDEENEEGLENPEENAKMNQEGEDSVVPLGYNGNYEDFHELTIDQQERDILNDLRGLSDKEGFEYGIAISDAGVSKPFTSKAPNYVEIPDDVKDASHLRLYHAHTNETPLSGKDFEWLTRENVDKVSVSAGNGDIFSVYVGNGFRPDRQEYVEALIEIMSQADDYIKDYPEYSTWTPEQKTYMAIREQAFLIARKFEWTLEGGK